MAKKSNCKRDYRSATNLDLENRADGVRTGIYTNATTFATPPITQVALTALISNYTTTRIAHDQGGTAQLPAFTAARKALTGGLDNLATYVDGVATGNAQIVKLAGFTATNDPNNAAKTIGTNATPATAQNVTFKRVENQSGQMVAECEKYPNDCKFITFLVENNELPAGIVVDDAGNVFIPSGLTVAISINIDTKRKKLFKGLNTGSNYYVYYVVVNTKGASGISDGKKMLCG